MKGTGTRVVAVAAALASMLLSRRAGAQDFGVGPQKEPASMPWRVGLESSWTRFSLNGHAGDAFGITARADLKVAPNVSLRVLVPAYGLRLDDGPYGEGLGDAELRVRVRIFDRHPWRIYAGVAEQLPTGDTTLGTGQGGSQLTPFVTGGWRTGGLVLYAAAADALALHPRGKPAPFDYVDPSADHELRYALGAIYELTETWYLSGALSGITVLTPDDAGDTLGQAGAAVGLVLSTNAKLVAVGQFPLFGARRFDDKLGLNAYVYF